MRFVHAADLHLDSPLRGLAHRDGAPVDRIREATRRALENLIQLCLEEEAACLLLAGDIYDGDWKDYGTGLFFASQLGRLREAGTRVLLVRGNHDAASEISRGLPLPGHVHELPSKGPETVLLEDLGLAVHGQSFARRAVTDDLASGYPEAVAGYLNVGLLHTCLDGREGHDPYAPTSLGTLRGKGYDYWALGHVHQREVLSEDPWVVFPGNLQGRHARETGPKGATVVTAEDQRITDVVHRPLDVVRWARLEVDAGDADSAETVMERTRADLEAAVEAAEGRLVAARVTVTGESAAHDALLRDAERWENAIRAIAYDVDDLWVEKIRLRTRAPIDRAELATRDDAIGQLFRSLRDLRGDEEAVAALGTHFAELEKKLPREAREGDDGVRLNDPAYLREALEDVERLLLPRVLGPAEGT